MGGSDFSGGYAHAIDFRADLEARLHDLIARKAPPSLGRLRALLQRLGSTFSDQRTLAAVRSLLGLLRRETAAAPPAACPESNGAELAERILAASGESTLDCYPAYLFTVKQGW